LSNKELKIYLKTTRSKTVPNREVMCIVFCDISKAFDKVWHRGLLKKLKAYGISGNLLHWFENYLSDRNQKVVLQNCHTFLKECNNYSRLPNFWKFSSL
jgi:hypothetical protein